MATKLGAEFLRCALGPLHYAGGCIVAGKVSEGIDELASDGLHGGFTRGVAEAARHAGVSDAEVLRLLPIDDVDLAAARLDAAQREAAAAWRAHAGQLGGMLTGVADLTVDGRAPDASNVLERLSKKVVRDPPLSVPLHRLSLEVACWLDLVERCGDRLAEGGALARAYRARKIRRVLLGLSGAVALLALLPLWLRLRAARARVDAILASADACASLAIAPADLARASSEARQRAAQRSAACEEARRTEVLARERARLGEEKGREEERVRREREAKCATLADHLAAGAVQPEDANLAAGKESLVVRVARRSLAVADATVTDLPCADTPAGDRIATLFVTAMLASPAAWANADDVSERVAKMLIDHRAELPTAAKYQLLAHADLLSRRAIAAKSAAAADVATRMCKLKDDLGVKGARYCPALALMRAKGKL